MRYAIRGVWRGQEVDVTWEDGRLDGPAELVIAIRSRASRTRDVDLRRPADALLVLQQVMDGVDVVVFDRGQPAVTFRAGRSTRQRRK